MSGAPKGDTGGAIAGQATSAAALMQIENERRSLALQQASMSKDIQLKDAEIELKKTEAQSKLMKQSKDQQLAMWNSTNYEAQTAHLQAAGLNPALMYGAGGGGGSTTAGSGAGGQTIAIVTGKQIGRAHV